MLGSGSIRHAGNSHGNPPLPRRRPGRRLHLRQPPGPRAMKADADIVVVGAGLAGLAAAVSLARAGLSVVHVAPAAPPDRRTSALMMPSVDFLRRSGLVDDPAAIGHALTAIRIIDATPRLIRAPETLFEAAEAGLPAFGWNFGNARLLARFQSLAPSTGLQTRDAAVVSYE